MGTIRTDASATDIVDRKQTRILAIHTITFFLRYTARGSPRPNVVNIRYINIEILSCTTRNTCSGDTNQTSAFLKQTLEDF